jgi:hypothetical protein
MIRLWLIILICIATQFSFGQDSPSLKIHFLYGSKPLRKFKDTEKKWFGGVLGGHVGIESTHDRILNFVPRGKFHWFSKDRDRNSQYAVHSVDHFYNIFGNTDSVKKLIVTIPITHQQKLEFDSIANVYLNDTPYDYALFGMRCAAGAYDVLGELGVVRNYNNRAIARKIFYPRKLRKRILKLASKNNWTIERTSGSKKRKWDKD